MDRATAQDNGCRVARETNDNGDPTKFLVDTTPVDPGRATASSRLCTTAKCSNNNRRTGRDRRPEFTSSSTVIRLFYYWTASWIRTRASTGAGSTLDAHRRATSWSSWPSSVGVFFFLSVNFELLWRHRFRIVPPQKIRIIEDNRQVSSVIGPYDEGGQLSLNCIVSGGIKTFGFWLFSSLVHQSIRLRATASGSQLVAGRQTGGPHICRHVGECRPECARHPAAGTATPTRRPALPGVQLLWRPQQHAALLHDDDLRTPTAAPTATTTTSTTHDRLQRSTRSQP